MAMVIGDFLLEFKRATEERWRVSQIKPTIYGFQFQGGTRWNHGLSDRQIAEYESSLALRFPNDLRAFLQEMNGTDLPTINIYGYCGEPPRESVGVYVYPRDLALVKKRIEDVRNWRAELTKTLADQGFDLQLEAGLFPIYIHRYVICSSDPTRSVVLSINDGRDAIVYGSSLTEYLSREFLPDQK